MPLPMGAGPDAWLASCGCGETGTGCSSRETSFSPMPLSLIRSVICLPDGAEAGTILLGVASALMTGGGAEDDGPPNSAR